MLMLIGEAVLSIGMMLMAAAVSAVAVSSLEKGNDVIVLIGSIMAFFICYGAGNVVYTFLKIRNSLIHIEMRLEWYVPELFLKCMGMSWKNPNRRAQDSGLRRQSWQFHVTIGESRE